MDEKNPLNELSESLRPTVEQVRAVAPPVEAMERSQDRAQQMGPPWSRRPRRWLGYCAAAGIAAAVFVAFGLWPERTQRESRQVALNQRGSVLKTQEKSKNKTPHLSEPAAKRISDSPSNTFILGNSRTKVTEVITVPGVVDLTETDPQWHERAAWSKRMSRPGRQYVTEKQAHADVRLQLQRGNEGMMGGMGRMGMSGGMMGMAGIGMGGMGMKGMGGTPTTQGVPTISRQDAIKVAQAYRDFRKKQLERHTGLLAEKAIDARLVDEQADRLQEAEELVKTLETDGKTLQRSQAELLDHLKQEIKTQELVLNKSILSRTNNADIARKALRETREDLKSLEARIAELKSQVRSKPEKNQPQVWHRDRSRPSFARVYVGDNNSLELVSLHVSVTIEGPRARTVVDHIFRNPHDRQLEGTFEYPLPTGASPSYFGMFLGQTRDTVPVRFARRGDNAALPAAALANMTPSELVKHVDTADWGRLQEGRIVSKEKALETYEEVVRGRIDPALLEYAGGNTFSGRVFPIPPKGYNRVILAYEELLPFAQEHMIYRFPLPNRKLNELQFHLQASAAECLQPSFAFSEASRQRKLPDKDSAGRLTFSKTWKNETPTGEVMFACTPANPIVQAVSGRQGDNGPRYVYARLRPSLPTLSPKKGRGQGEGSKNKAFASHAVFLLDTSLSEHPERFAVNVKLLQKILENDGDIEHFNILTFNVGAAWLDAQGWFANTVAGRTNALKKLDGIVLEGATDLSCALDKLAALPLEQGAAKGTPLNVFLLSDGHITWGEPDVAALTACFERNCPYPTRFHCYRTGLGEENSELYEALTRKGGGVFQCYGEAELEAASKAHRSQCLQVKRVRFVGGPEVSDVLVSGRRAAVYPGGELVVGARCNGVGRTTLIVEGEYAGKEMVQEFPLEVRSGSELAPRAWAEVAVASLLALHDSNFDTLVTAYCQQFGIVSRVASFLVLENEADYKRFNLEEERGKTVAGDLGTFLGEMWARLSKRLPAAKEFERFLNRVDKHVHLLDGPQGVHVKQLLAALTEEDFELPIAAIRGDLVHAKNVAAYLAERERDRRNVGVYLTEARRRSESGDVDGAVRVLSSIIEEHPGRGDALRLVGYRLLDLQQPAQAARLFAQVQKQRPFEPHSYRDFAHALEQSGHYGLSALNYEAVLAGTWHNRFRQELKLVAQEEYAHMMQEAIRTKRIGDKLANLFGERLEQMVRPQPKSDLRVTIAWNTDATDVDLWVIEPDGTKCFYQHNRTKNGGELSQDQTQGYGPERYQIAHAQPGVYTLIVHYFGINPNLLGGETHVSATVTRFAGTPQEKTERHTVILKKHNEQVEVCKIKF